MRDKIIVYFTLFVLSVLSVKFWFMSFEWSKYVKTEGTVVEVREEIVRERVRTHKHTVWKNVMHYFPVVEYATTDGEIFTEKSNVGDHKRKRSVGDSVSIKYNPDNPSTYVFTGDNVILIIVTIGFSMVTALAAYFIIFRRRNETT